MVTKIGGRINLKKIARNCKECQVWYFRRFWLSIYCPCCHGKLSDELRNPIVPPEHKQREYSRRWVSNNRDKRNEYRRKWYSQNKAKFNEYMRKYRMRKKEELELKCVNVSASSVPTELKPMI